MEYKHEFSKIISLLRQKALNKNTKIKVQGSEIDLNLIYHISSASKWFVFIEKE